MQKEKPTGWRRSWFGLTDADRFSFLWLVYLGFLFMPPFGHPPLLQWLVPTLLSLPVFLTLYFWHHNRRLQTHWSTPVGMGLLSCLLLPFNSNAYDYMIYACALTPFAFPGRGRAMGAVGVALTVLTLEYYLLGYPLFIIAVCAVASLASCLGNTFFIENASKNAALKQSHEEVRRLATLAERERIGRDLHDLLGHTLSLVAIKSELAEKLIHRDVAAAAREIADVKGIARNALREVRSAVTGIRAAALEGEIAAARVLLVSSGVELTASTDTAGLSPELESGAAMIVREAVTNIHRHAQARHAAIEIRSEAATVILTVRDDGRGGITRQGNGLAGIGERVRSLGGTLDIKSAPGTGTSVCARLPLGART